MSLDHAAEHLAAAVRTLARGEAPLGDRLQSAWHDNVQMVWMKPCLTTPLLVEFKQLWERYTAPAEDPHSTKLRVMGLDELQGAVDEILSLATRTADAARDPAAVVHVGPIPATA